MDDVVGRYRLLEPLGGQAGLYRLSSAR